MQSLRKGFPDGFPNAEQFVLLPEIRSIVDVGGPKQITLDEFRTLEPSLSDLVSTWKAACVDTLVRQINRETTANLPPDADLSSLALGTFYGCSTCGLCIFRQITADIPLERPRAEGDTYPDLADNVLDRKSTRLNSSHSGESRMPSSA